MLLIALWRTHNSAFKKLGLTEKNPPVIEKDKPVKAKEKVKFTPPVIVKDKTNK